LEEYYVGELTLQVCNGVTDGSFAIIGLTLLTGFIGGNNIWATPIYDATAWHWRGVTIMTLGQAFGLFVGILHVLLATNK
jgi:hypothetical protein